MLIYNELKNTWTYDDVASIIPSSRTGGHAGEFVVNFHTRNRVETLKFSSNYTADIISQVLAGMLSVKSDYGTPWVCNGVSWYREYDKTLVHGKRLPSSEVAFCKPKQNHLQPHLCVDN
ncbi:hypothetical protein D918_05252 [Trichuris suis]|nr:hypothetical protein D918_05252 [Trichuris suis]